MKRQRWAGGALAALRNGMRRASLPHSQLLSTLLTAGVFGLDCVTPADFVVGVFYLIAMVLAAGSRSRRWLAGIGAAACSLTVLAGLIGLASLPGTHGGVMWTNRGLTVLALAGLLAVLDRTVVAQGREALLRREIDHRAKNVLAVVAALLRLVPRDEPAQFARRVEQKILAMARVHSLLAEARWEGADLQLLAQRELAPFAGPPGRLRLDGPAVRISAEAAQPLGMFLHELATNSAKHGAFSVPTGSLHLRWHVEPDSADLLLEWTELGGPPIDCPPERHGFGTRLTTGLIRQIGGSMEHAWHLTGLRCRIRVPHQTFARPE
ncbi:HWE histidine kinase domain-containing protein [Dankookia sp. GCM10030260]|uniref:HWE histidine kinase domain-containing protein n=1 Tax=Dankookia sp. GCM10030260 TaxID=3273390 RepID=UPI003611EDC0